MLRLHTRHDRPASELEDQRPVFNKLPDMRRPEALSVQSSYILLLRVFHPVVCPGQHKPHTLAVPDKHWDRRHIRKRRQVPKRPDRILRNRQLPPVRLASIRIRLLELDSNLGVSDFHNGTEYQPLHKQQRHNRG